MKRCICLALLLILLLSVFSACKSDTPTTDDTKGLTYYAVKNQHYAMYDVIERYNKKCNREGKSELAIEVIGFETEDEMYTKLSTEMMSGKGADLFSLDQNIPFEKLMKNNMFLDIDEVISSDTTNDKIDFSQYNEAVMNSGVLEGKRYVVPLFYGVNYMIADKSQLQKFNIPTQQGYSLTYDNIESDFKDYFKSDSDVLFMDFDEYAYYYNDYFEIIFRNLIDSFADYENKTCHFDTKAFRDALSAIDKIKARSGKAYTDMGDMKPMLFPVSFNTGCFKDMAMRQKDNDIIMKGFSKNAKDNPAHVQIGVAFNKNCKKYEAILYFLKYILGEDAQEYFCCATGNTIYGNISHPVRSEAFEESIRAASEAEDDFGKKLDIDTEFMQAYINMSKNITSCTLIDNSFMGSNYYAKNVVNDLIIDYKYSKISQERFIKKLTSATNLYLNE